MKTQKIVGTVTDNNEKSFEVTDIYSAVSHLVEYLNLLQTEKHLPVDYKQEKQYIIHLLSQLLALATTI